MCFCAKMKNVRQVWCAFCIVTVSFVFVARAKKLPAYVTLCNRYEQDLNNCILRAVDQVRPHLKNGIPELYVPNLDPLYVTRVELNSGDSFKASFDNLEIYNAHNFEVRRIRAELENNYLELDLYFPYLQIDSVYNINGHILFLQLEGNGKCTGNYSDVYSNTTIQGEREKRNGQEYIRFVKTDLQLKIGKVTLQFDNLFNGDGELTRQINAAINNNMDDLISELNPVINEAVSKIIFGFLAEIFNRIPVESLFPI